MMRHTLEDVRRKLTEHSYKNEEHVRLSLVIRLLQELGWDIWNPAEVNTEFNAVPDEDYSRVDIALFLTPYSPSVFIEVKAVGKLEGNLRQYETQLRDYNRNNTAVFTVITDGHQWRLYYSQTGGEFSKKCFKTLDLLADDIEELEHSFQLFLSRAELSSGDARQKAEKYLQLSQRQRAMEDLLPQARKAVLDPPYPSLPQAVVELVRQAGITLTIEEATQFIQEDNRRRPPPEPVTNPVTKPSTSQKRTGSGNTNLPRGLADVLAVCDQVFYTGRDYTDAVKFITKQRQLNTPTTIADACTRRLGIDTPTFKGLLQDKRRLVEHLIKYFPEYEDAIRQVLQLPRH